MLKKNIEITNVYGNKETKVLHFNLTRMEVYDLQKKYKEGYEQHIKNAMDSNNEDSQMDVFRDFIKNAYCEIDENGNVIKNEKLTEIFLHSEEYSELMFELLNKEDQSKAEEFFKGIMPKQLQSELNKVNTNNQVSNQNISR